MSNLSADTKKMKKNGEDLKLLAKKYNKTILNFQTTMHDMNCWTGDDANAYKKDVLANCDIYEQIGDVLYQYADFLVKEADRLERFAKENNI